MAMVNKNLFIKIYRVKIKILYKYIKVNQVVELNFY